MDTAAILDQYTQDISNLPAELQHLLSELGTSDTILYEIRKKISQKDSTIHKFIKQHGSLTKNPKENQLYPKIREDFKKAEQQQKEKCISANTALFLTAKHLIKLENDMEKLKAEGLLVSDNIDLELEENLFSSRGTSRGGTAGLPNASSYDLGFETTPAPPTKKKQKATLSKVSTPSVALPDVTAVNSTVPTPTLPTKTLKRQRHEDTKTPDFVNSVTKSLRNPELESVPAAESNGHGGDEDKNLYCFCQNVSFGEMVGCDNDDCKYEWFHYECVGLKEPPKGKWYCSDCQEKMKSREKKKRKL
jgi:chromatin modification-related protein YNG2